MRQKVGAGVPLSCQAADFAKCLDWVRITATNKEQQILSRIEARQAERVVEDRNDFHGGASEDALEARLV